MGILGTIILGAVVGWIVGAIGYTLDQSLTADGADWYFDLLWVPGLWGGLLVTVVVIVLWMAGVVSGKWAAATFIGWIALLSGAWVWSAITTWMGVL